MNDYVQLTRRGLAAIGTQVTNELVWGYGHCLTENDKELIEYYHAVHLLRNQQLEGTVCLCDEEIDSIKSGIHRILGPECSAVSKDFTREPNPDADRWLLKNPLCVAYDYAADYLAALCARVGVDFKIIKKRCDEVGIDIKITDHVICDAVDLVLDIQEKKCDFNLDLKIDLHECIVDFETKITPLNCGVDLKTYIELVNCGVSVDTIVTQLNCGATVDLILNDVDACFTDVESEAVNTTEPTFELARDSAGPVCWYTDIEISIENPAHPAIEYSWDFGSGATPATGEGEGPFTVQYTTSGAKTVTVTATFDGNETVETLPITILQCFGNITGTVVTDVGGILQGVNVRLYTDTDWNGIADNATTVRSVFTNSSGIWSMASVTPGQYVIVMSTTVGDYTLVSAIDTNPVAITGTDVVNVPNVPTTDGVIPITVSPQLINQGNVFTFHPNDGVISGYVFDDADADVSPDAGEGFEGAIVNLYADDNKDGVPGVLIDTTTTDEDGYFEFTATVGWDSALSSHVTHYVIELEVPEGYDLVSGIDSTIDGDTVVNTPTTDNLIPVSLTAGETDADNRFIIEPTP